VTATAAATAALADDDRAPRDGMTGRAISQIVTYAGNNIIQIEFDGHPYRVEAYEPAGEKVELRVMAEDGAILPPAAAHDTTAAIEN
jgi:hypothetical protein